MTLKEVLSEAEKTKLAQIAEDNTMKSALRKVLLFPIYYNGILEAGQDPDPTMNFALGLMGQSRNMPDDHLGRVLRGQMEGITMLEQGMTQIDKFKEQKEIKKDNINQAR